MAARHHGAIVVVGGGIAGLSAAIYARLNDFEATVYEMAQKPGGVCAGWERSGFLVNGSIHWLVGSAPGSDLHDMWMQLGVLDDHPHLSPARFALFRDLDGVDVHLWRDPDKLQVHLSEISPDDADTVAEMCDAIRVFRDAEFPMRRDFELLSLTEWIGIFARNMPFMLAHRRYGALTVEDYAARFRHPALQGMLRNFWTPGLSMQFLLMQLGFAARGTAAYPLGGSGPFIDRLVRRLEGLGGRIETGVRVTGIDVSDGKATGLFLADGRRVAADHVIAACDATQVFDRLLPGGEALRPESLDHLTTFPPLCYFSAGASYDFAGLETVSMGHNLRFDPPLQVGPVSHPRATVQIYSFDPTLAPRGQVLLTAMLDSDYDWWRARHDEGADAYRRARDSIADAMIDGLDRHFPGLRDGVVFRDLATPLTYERYTGNHRGAYEGWLPTPAAAKARIPTHFDAVRNFWMAGHWVAPGGGMPPAAYTGRNAVQLICDAEDIEFRVGLP
ncbi:MAG: phytoene desaturase family protein [Rhodosalinus sp.]